MPSTGIRRASVAVAWALSTLLVILWTAWASNIDWVPAGPRAEDPGYGSGSDWDRRWHWATLDVAARDRGERAWWDPFLDFGQPMMSDPENFLLHPAWQLGSRGGDAVGGFDSLLAFSCALLALGLLWLGRELRIPPPLTLASGLFLLCSAEWSARLGAGHITFLGVTLWPALLAALLRATSPGAGAPTGAILWGAVGGVCLGLSGLIGGHYALPFGLLLGLLLLWARGAPTRVQHLVVGLFAAVWLVRGVPASGRWLTDLALIFLLGWGIRRSSSLRRQAAAAVGLALGLLASAGAFLVTAAGRARQIGRMDWGFSDPPPVEPLSLEGFWQPPSLGLEGLLDLPSAGAWGAAAVGLLLLLRAAPALGTAALVASFTGLSGGLPLLPWEVLSQVPGLSATDYIERLQWVILVLAPLGFAAVLPEAGSRLLGERGRWGLSLGAATALVLWLVPSYSHDPKPESLQGQDLPPAAASVQGVSGARGALMSSAVADGLILPNWGEDERLPPEASQGLLAWRVVDGSPTQAGPDVRLEPDLNRWTVVAPPGSVIALAQRDHPGWTCSGGSQKNYPNLVGKPEARAWLSFETGETGKVECRWRPPGLWPGRLLQSCASLLLLLLVGRVWRSSSPLSLLAGEPDVSSSIRASKDGGS